MEELKTLTDATYIASGNATRTPPGFVADYYWSSTAVPSNSTWAYSVDMTSGNIGDGYKATDSYVRCVR